MLHTTSIWTSRYCVWLTDALGSCRHLCLGPPNPPSAVCARRISQGTQQPQPQPQSPNIAAAQYELGVRISWQRRTESSTERYQDRELVIKGGVEGIADALAQPAAKHGLTVSMQDSGRHVVLSRT